MKRFILLSILLTAGFAASAQIPSAKLEDRTGREILSSSIVDGETPAVISFWAVTCDPCIQELDAICEAFEEWQEQADFRIIAVSTDDVRHMAKAKALTKGHMWDCFTLLFDPNNDFKRAMNVVDTPQVFVIDSEGKIAYSHTGYNPGSEKEILEALKKVQ
ncbi:MAG: peroxiredoxin family protein [Candidatus Cryptobacteroides sp.]